MRDEGWASCCSLHHSASTLSHSTNTPSRDPSPDTRLSRLQVTPVDVFMALNQDGDDVMSMEEFQRLFELLELDLKEEQKEQLFAYDGTRLGRGASHARTAP